MQPRVLKSPRRNYWGILFTGTTWADFVAAGATISGFRQRRWRTVHKVQPGDYLLCYLTGIMRWIGVLEVISTPFWDSSPIWKDEDYPCRLKIKVVVSLTPETGVPIHALRDELSIFQNLKCPAAWTVHLRGSPTRWKRSDGEAVVRALLEAERSPVVRPVDPAKLARRPRPLKSRW